MTSAASTTARGYGANHQQLRARWQTTIDTGNGWCTAIHCLQPTRWIPPGSPWDLGHSADRTYYRGPEHRRCNRADGGRRGANRRHAHRRRLITNVTSRTW